MLRNSKWLIAFLLFVNASNAAIAQTVGALACNISGSTITCGGSSLTSAPGGSTTQLQYNNAGAFGGISGWITNGTTTLTGGASTTLSVGGATIGANALAVTGSFNIGPGYIQTTTNQNWNLSSIAGRAGIAAVTDGFGGFLPGSIDASTLYLNANSGGVVSIPSGTVSSSTLTGALTVGGGLGVVGAIFTGTLTVSGVSVNTDVWTAYTPTMACGAGSGTWINVFGRYKVILGKTTNIALTATLSAIGTCSGSVTFTLPNTAANASITYWIFGREVGVSGNLLGGQILAGGTAVTPVSHAAAAPIASGSIYQMTGVYENQ